MATAIAKNVKRDILAEMGPEYCRVAALATGCYGHLGYMEENYGIAPDYAKRVEATIPDVIAFIKEEHGVEVTVNQVAKIMQDGHEKMEEAWDALMGY